MKRTPLLILSAFLLNGPARSAEVTMVADVSVFGGQHFFQGAVSDVSGNFDAVVTPSMKFNERWSLVPTWQGSYRGTRDVQELAGGGTLFQDSSRQGLTVKGVREFGNGWKVKPSLGYAREWLRETKDEKFGKGLFDNQKVSGGVEGEKNFSKTAGLRVSYDYYMLSFPNYQSLESAAGATFSRELAGKNVLDSKNHLLTVSGWSPFPGSLRAEWNVYYNMRSFDDQKTVDLSGSLTGTDRADKTLSFAGSLGSRPWGLGESVKVLGDVGLSYAMNESNQNHYDASKTVFISDYYNYSEWSAKPRVTGALGSAPWVVSGEAGYTQRKYSDRPVQDAGGNYLTAKTRVTEISTSVGVTYPYSKSFKLRAVSTLAWSDSNMKYEKTFRYNYRIANYMLGFSYAY